MWGRAARPAVPLSVPVPTLGAACPVPTALPGRVAAVLGAARSQRAVGAAEECS